MKLSIILKSTQSTNERPFSSARNILDIHMNGENVISSWSNFTALVQRIFNCGTWRFLRPTKYRRAAVARERTAALNFTVYQKLRHFWAWVSEGRGVCSRRHVKCEHGEPMPDGCSAWMQNNTFGFRVVPWRCCWEEKHTWQHEQK